MWAKRSSSISGSALLRNSSAQVFCSRFALAGGTRNSDSNRLPWGTRGRNIALFPPLSMSLLPWTTPYHTLAGHLGQGVFTEESSLHLGRSSLPLCLCARRGGSA